MACLKFESVRLEYPIYNSKSTSLRSQLVRLGTGGMIEKEAGQRSHVLALNNVSFSISNGDCVGLVGHNGAGKSTLLRTMAGIYKPTSGKITSEGSIVTILDLGSGMDYELTGYDNIYRMGVIKGFTIDQVKSIIPYIEQFTDLGDFLGLPVRTYSSGMAARLMFAMATSKIPDIFLVDEVFGMGDSDFYIKAKEKMESIIDDAHIFVLASHNNEIIKNYCNRFFKMSSGSIVEISKGEV